mmetsp:Transcript_71786/g.156280  ORF Transcript_71786/g.156280 Transcript_71786/m.156280 type:complete len:85 (-) Transcript_71786:216-470(-)
MQGAEGLGGPTSAAADADGAAVGVGAKSVRSGCLAASSVAAAAAAPADAGVTSEQGAAGRARRWFEVVLARASGGTAPYCVHRQ